VADLDVRRLTPAIGAEVAGIDLGGPLSDDDVAALRALLVEHEVIFLRDQSLTHDAHVELARRFGQLDIPTFDSEGSTRPEVLVLDQVKPVGQGTDRWHADGTHRPEPPMGSILHAVHLPEGGGGDTCFASMSAAYANLSPAVQELIDPLTAVHTLAMVAAMAARNGTTETINDDIDQGYPSSVHPVVAVHPESGRKVLNVNSNWTSHIVELTEAESEALLALLFAQVKEPAIQVRFAWTPGAVAFWDNRAVQHYAVPDYAERRVMQRVSVLGERPVGIGAPASS
jgi:taurine dioxygenase